MDAYRYNDALICPSCAARVRRDAAADAPNAAETEGPLAHGGGEADTPQHCALCHDFLENPLTPAGLAQMAAAIAAGAAFPFLHWHAYGDQAVIAAAARHRIAAANDAFRRATTTNVYFTRSLADEGPVTCALILARVRAFSAFTPDNDPWGEHDCGAFEHPLSEGGTPQPATILWKIDTYADHTLTHGAENPLAADIVRVLTIMPASDY